MDLISGRLGRPSPDRSAWPFLGVVVGGSRSEGARDSKKAEDRGELRVHIHLQGTSEDSGVVGNGERFPPCYLLHVSKTQVWMPREVLRLLLA